MIIIVIFTMLLYYVGSNDSNYNKRGIISDGAAIPDPDYIFLFY